MNIKVDVDFLSIGKKSSEHFTKNNYNILSTHDDLYSNLTFSNTSEIAQSIMDLYSNEEYDKVVLLYNQFKKHYRL